MKKTHDYVHFYRGYWSDGGKCRIQIYHEDDRAPVVVCSQLPDNHNTSVTNMAEYLAAEVMEEHGLSWPLIWIEHYSEHEEEIGEYSLVGFSSWRREEVCLGGVWRYRVGSPRWRSLRAGEVQQMVGHPHRSGRAVLSGHTARPWNHHPRYRPSRISSVCWSFVCWSDPAVDTWRYISEYREMAILRVSFC
jgi:hypothetical protein